MLLNLMVTESCFHKKIIGKACSRQKQTKCVCLNSLDNFSFNSSEKIQNPLRFFLIRHAQHISHLQLTFSFSGFTRELRVTFSSA